MDALRRLQSEPEVYFDQPIVPVLRRDGRPRDDADSPEILAYDIPPDGDLVTRLTVQGADIREVRVEIMGEVALSRADFAPGCTVAHIPVRINLLRLGYHRATVRVEGSDVSVVATFKLLSDLAERRRIALSEPLI